MHIYLIIFLLITHFTCILLEYEYTIRCTVQFRPFIFMFVKKCVIQLSVVHTLIEYGGYIIFHYCLTKVDIIFIYCELTIEHHYPFIFFTIFTIAKMIRNTTAAATIIPIQNPALKISPIKSQLLNEVVINRKMAACIRYFLFIVCLFLIF